MQAAQEAVQQVADSSKETVDTGRVHAQLSFEDLHCNSRNEIENVPQWRDNFHQLILKANLYSPLSITGTHEVQVHNVQYLVSRMLVRDTRKSKDNQRFKTKTLIRASMYTNIVEIMQKRRGAKNGEQD